MDNIICHTVNCEHNVKSRCVAGIVNITEKGVCASKIKREGGILAQTFADIEAAEDFGTGNIENSVTCASVKCAYNSDGVCSAAHIVVEDGLSKTRCFTRNVK